MKKTLPLIIGLICHLAKAQSLSPAGFASLAGSYSNSNAQLDFNLGESVIGALSNTTNFLTNGTIQPQFLSNAIPLTQLRSIDCGKLNLSPDAQIIAVSVPNAMLYHFEFKDASTGLLYGQRITSTNVITPNMVQPALLWNQQYLVRVKVMLGGQWGEFGNPCTIGLMQDPSITGVPITVVRTQYCNLSGIALNANIVCNPVSMANRYEFKFTNTQNGNVHFYQSLTTTCPLSMLSPPLIAGVNYQVQVRAKVYTTWGNYGNSCNMNTITPQAAGREELFVEPDTLIDEFLPENSLEYGYAKLTIYPNPFNDEANILIETLDDELTNFYLYDLTGRLVNSINGISNHPVQIDNSIIPGAYVIIAITNSGKQQSTKILKIN
jgi:hypothetical protein